MVKITDVSHRVWESTDMLSLKSLQDGDRVVMMTEDFSLYFIMKGESVFDVFLRMTAEYRPDLGLQTYLQNMGEFGWPSIGFARTLLRFFRTWDILAPGDAFQHHDLDADQWHNAEPIREIWLSRSPAPVPAQPA